MQCLSCGTIAPDGARYCASCGSVVSDPAAPTMVATAEQDALLTSLREQFDAEYEIQQELGRGGMAIVFRAVERDLRRTVALKVLPPEMALVAALAERFKREARLAAALDHPNIIPVYRVGQLGGFHFIAMKFIEGRALDAIVSAQGRLPIPAVLAVLRSGVAALAYAHEKGIVHRDIKGGNILIETTGRVVVSDFGIARAIEDSTMTASGAVIGTPYFMSPEQCSGLRVGPQSDQYSMGIVAFQIITGAVPFMAETLPGIMQHHFFTPVPDMTLSRPDIPLGLVEVVQRALAKKPEDRYATTYDMLSALEAIPIEGAGAGDDPGHGFAMLRESAGGDASAAPPRTGYDPASRGTAPRAPSGARTGSGAATTPGAGATRPSSATPRASTAGAGGARASGTRPTGAGSTAVPSSRVTPLAASAAPAPPRKSRAWIWVVLVLLILGGGSAVAFGTLDARVAPARVMRRAVEHYRVGDRRAAQAEFRRLTNAHPALPLPHIYLGRMAREEGDSTTARRELETAIQFAPDNALAERELASLFLWEKDYENARKAYVRTLELDPGDRTAMGFLACTLRRLGRDDEADRFAARAGDGGWNLCARRE